jgi:hypothetical protein
VVVGGERAEYSLRSGDFEDRARKALSKGRHHPSPG